MFIQAKNLCFRYKEGAPPVIDGMNIAIKKGAFTAIIGHNGSGKSTLAKLFCGLLIPTEGDVTVDGISTRDEDRQFELRRKCGMVFQNPDNQIVASVVEEDVAFAPENLGLPSAEIRRRVDGVLKLVDMEGYAKHSTYKLSGGQKQRVAIAGILAMEPECIIFDEATAMLDPAGRRGIIAAMKKLNREKSMTVVAITHHMNEAVEADRVIVLNHGKIYADGTPLGVFADVENIRNAKLNAPQVTELMYALEQGGYKCGRAALHAMDAAEQIERLFI